jgi:hypothetical protein
MGTNSIGWGNIRMIPGDLAKIGYLYLNNGKWEDQQIISPGWIRAATKKTVTRKKSNGYGYLWWIYKDNLYSALGRGGQFMYIYPDENMIVVFTGGGSDYSPAKKKMIRNYIIPAIVESNGPIPNSPDNTRILEQCIQRAGSAPVYHPEHFEPSAIADRISGIEYNLEPNKFGIESFVITAESENEAIIKMNLSLDSDRNPEYRIGLDNVPRFSEGRFGIPATAKGAWRSESTFTIWLNEIGNINCFRIEISFDNGRVRFDLYDKTGLGSASINGKVH